MLMFSLSTRKHLAEERKLTLFLKGGDRWGAGAGHDSVSESNSGKTEGWLLSFLAA